MRKKIINGELAKAGLTDEDFSDKLVTWADAIRKTFNEGGCDEVVSTRRLVQIVETFSIFGDKTKALSYCLNRFDDETKFSFIDLYSKVDAGASVDDILKVEEPEVEEEPETDEIESDGNPF